MRVLHFVVFFSFFGGITNAQVGIGTTSPSALLDIRSSSLTAPNNNDGLLIPKINAFPTTNPGAAQDGMMVYVTGAGTPAKGFYYWNNASTNWLSFLSSSEWIDNGTYLSPADGNTEDVTIGGADNVNSRFTVRSSKQIAGLFTNTSVQNTYMYGLNTFLSNNSTMPSSFTIGIYNDVINEGVGSLFGSYNRIRGDGGSRNYGAYNILSGASTGEQYGSYQGISNSGNNSHTGTYNALNGSGSGTHTGTFNDIYGVSSGSLYGTYNGISSSGNGTHIGSYQSLQGNGSGAHIAVSNSFLGSGTGDQIGVSNYIDVSEDGDHSTIENIINSDGNGAHYGVRSSLGGSGSGIHYGNSTVLSGTGSGAQYGVQTTINNTGAGDHYGVFNTLSGAATGSQVGLRNNISNSGNFLHTGVWNSLSGSGAATKIGLNNIITNGSGDHYGVYNSLSSMSGANKYGSYNVISHIAGGTHYGVYSNVLKTGSYAGYFLGNVVIGTSASDTYRLPVSRGVSGQVMQTDASGNVNWVNHTSIGVRYLDDLLDGRSDNDGSNTGSSVFLGVNAGAVDDFTDNKNVGIGLQSMAANTSGERNTAVGNRSLSSNTTGSYQVALGYLALANSNGNGNIAIGDQCLRINSTGRYNLGAGYYSLNANSTGENNVALGNQSMLNNNTGNYNTALGSFSMSSNTIGVNNTAIGSSTLSLNAEGSNNIALGHGAGQNTQTVLADIPNKNIIIGYNIDLPNLSGSNQLNIGNLIYGNGLTGFGQTISSGNIGIGVQSPLDRLDIGGILRVSTSATSAAQFRNDDNFNHLQDNNIDFGDQEDAWMVSSLEGEGENSGIYGDRDFVTVWAPADSNRLIRFVDEDLWVDNDGNPYNNSAELAYVDASGQFIQASDKNRKQNINQIENALTKIVEINGYTYEFKLNDQEITKKDNIVKTSGVIAQELYKVLPEAVQISEEGEYFVHYAGIIPLLIESIKEQQKEIEILKKEIDTLRNLEERIKKIEQSRN